MPHRAMAESTLAIGKRYEDFRDYIYEKVKEVDNSHRELRNQIIADIISTVGMIYEAAHSNQISRVRLLDARLATLRAHIRHLRAIKTQKVSSDGGIYHKNGLTRKQAAHSEMLLAHVGGMVYAWRKRLGDYKGGEERSKGNTRVLDDPPLDVKI